jgi:hypothetical protein
MLCGKPALLTKVISSPAATVTLEGSKTSAPLSEPSLMVAALAAAVSRSDEAATPATCATLASEAVA